MSIKSSHRPFGSLQVVIGLFELSDVFVELILDAACLAEVVLQHGNLLVALRVLLLQLVLKRDVCVWGGGTGKDRTGWRQTAHIDHMSLIWNTSGRRSSFQEMIQQPPRRAPPARYHPFIRAPLIFIPGSQRMWGVTYISTSSETISSISTAGNVCMPDLYLLLLWSLNPQQPTTQRPDIFLLAQTDSAR